MQSINLLCTPVSFFIYCMLIYVYANMDSSVISSHGMITVYHSVCTSQQLHVCDWFSCNCCWHRSRRLCLSSEKTWRKVIS